MKYLNINKDLLKKNNAVYTAMEISGQPELWGNILDKIISENNELQNFIEKVFKKVDKIILTGAGTSAYIGYSVEGAFQRKQNITTLSIPTTHLVSHPKDYFSASTPTLLVSFARSGNSPESVAALNLANKFCDDCYHLIITCNQQGELAKFKHNKNTYVFVLPPEADDKSLAMTGSYSGMLLSALLINDIGNINTLKSTVSILKEYGNKILMDNLELIKRVSSLPYKRAVFLGSGPQYGTAMESHLKLQELTDGNVICKNDSYLGFRHGPKAVVDENTLMVYYFSNKDEVIRYERDLVSAMEEGKKPMFQMSISEKSIEGISIDEQIVLSNNNTSIDEEYLSVSNILLGQLIGFYKSLDEGLQPDSPSVSGAISRVVKGVNIY